MMRKEFLKKHFKGEKIVLVSRRQLFYPFLVFLTFFNNISAQVPINGFCRYREFSVKPNFTNIFSVDFNMDGYRDLLIYSSSNNKYAALTSDAKSNLKLTTERFTSSAISDAHSFGKESTAKKILFVSRKSKQAVLGSFSARGALSVSSKIKFNGFPSKVDVEDIDGDGKPEGLISGATVNGLYLLKEKNRNLKETHIQANKIFSSACFIDLNYDSFADIAAVDLLSNSIILLYNDGRGNFTESRSIGLNSEINELKTADFNSDGFTDIIFIKNDRFEVLLGDSVSSFQQKFVVDTPVKPDKYTILDFNGNGFNDIAFINSQTGSLYILFAKSNNLFYPPILYMKKNGLTDLTAYIDRAGKKLAAISIDSKIFLINSVGIDQDSFSVTLGQKPVALKTFDLMSDKFKDICFIDETEQSLKLLLSERRNLCRTYFSIPLSSGFSEITVDDNKGNIKTFYCYSKVDRTIDIIRMNFNKQEYIKQTIYTDGQIEDLKLTSDRLKDRQIVYVLIKKNDQLLVQNFEFRDFRYTSSTIIFVTSNVERAWISFGVYKDIYSVSRYSQKIDLVKTVFDRKILESSTILTFNLTPKNNLFYNMICLNELIDRSRPICFLVTRNRITYLYLFLINSIKKYQLKKFDNEFNNLEYNISEGGDELTFYNYDGDRGILHSIAFKENKPPAEKVLFESKNINNYLVTNLMRKKTFLIFSNKLQNTLTFEKI